jgi:tRNA A-37 threonylcarbamoyl transferase component Bud32
VNIGRRLSAVKRRAILEALVPGRFEIVHGPGSMLAIRRDAGERLRRLAMARPEEREAGAASFHGRGRTQCLVYDPDRRRRAVFRRYRRGGLFRWLTRDKLFGAARPFLELDVVESARAHGVPTVEVLAVRVDRIGPFLYHGEMVTEELEDAPDLVQWLGGEAPRPAARRAIARALGESVARLHLAGVIHPDLHLKNLLVRPGDPPQAFVIDLDRAVRRRSGGGLDSDRMANLKRLDRSIQKHNFLGRGRVTRSDRLRFLCAYLRALDPDLGWREAAARLRARYPFRRLRWRLWRWWKAGGVAA